VQAQPVEMDEVRRRVRKRAVQLVPVRSTRVFVVRVGPVREDAAKMIPQATGQRMLTENRDRGPHSCDARFQCLARRLSSSDVRLMVPPIVRQQRHVELLLQLLEDVEGAAGHSAVRRIGRQWKRNMTRGRADMNRYPTSAVGTGSRRVGSHIGMCPLRAARIEACRAARLPTMK